MLNWRENLDAVISCIAQVEGQEWAYNERRILAEQLPDPVDFEYSVAAALKCFERFEPESEESGFFARSVYGVGGWNRWIFRFNGAVEFSDYHGRRGDADKARKLGFTVG